MKKIVFLIFCTLLFGKMYKVATTTSWEPFNTRIDGKLAGISVDYWKLISQKAGIKYEFDVKPTWIDVLNSIKNRTSDIALGAGITEERKKYAVFTKPYVTFPLVIATRNDVGFIPDVSFLQNRKIAVGKGYTAEALLKKHYPDLKIISLNSIEEALDMVKKGEVYAAIDILPVIAYKINKYQYNNLKISGQLDLKFPVRFMISKDNKELVDKINSAIDKLSIKEKEEIYEKWIKAQDNSKYLNMIILALAISVIFLLSWVFVLKNRLKKEKEYKEIMENLSYIDYLTGLNNQKKLFEVLRELIEKKENFCVMVFDILDFHEINKRYGHQIGDMILIEISSIVQGYINKEAVFGRIEADDFMIVFPSCNKEEICNFAEFLNEKLSSYNFGIEDKLKFKFIVLKHGEENLKEFVKIIQNALNKKISLRNVICN